MDSEERGDEQQVEASPTGGDPVVETAVERAVAPAVETTAEQQPTIIKVERRKRRWKLWLLLGVGALLIAILAAAGGFYLWFHSEVSASNGRVDPGILAALKETTSTTAPATGSAAGSGTTVSTLPDSPTGMNIVLVGYDKRAVGSAEKTEGRSDSIILVHVDPARNFVSMLSIPRDMLADIPGYGLYKLNASFAFGGGALLIRTIQAELGVDLDHYIAVDLEAFKAITNALGGVYMDVDRHYLNQDLSWEHIDLQPGYQLLNGADALDYVRFRHDDNIDFGRQARQQQFITAVREQALGWNLTFKIPSLVSGVFSNLDTDLSANDIIKLAYWGTKLDSGRIKQAEIKAKTGMIHGIFYVLPTDEEKSAAVRDFYAPPGTPTAQAGATTTSVSTTTSVFTTTSGASTTNSTAGATPGGGSPVAAALSPVSLDGVKLDVVNASGRAGQGALAGIWLKAQKATVLDIKDAAQPQSTAEVQYPKGHESSAQSAGRALGITQITETDHVEAITVVLGSAYTLAPGQLTAAIQAQGAPTIPNLDEWRTLASMVTFPVRAPTFVPYDYEYDFQRQYHIVPNDHGKVAIRVGYKDTNQDQYVGVNASEWIDAPLASPGVKVQGDGIVYTIVGSSSKVDHVWWVKDNTLYWVTNTLFGYLDREEMLAVAMSLTSLPAKSGV